MNRIMNIRRLREDLGMSQRYVADRIGVTPAAVAQWELGMNKPSADNLLALADLFGCTLDALFGRNPSGSAAHGIREGTP